MRITIPQWKHYKFNLYRNRYNKFFHCLIRCYIYEINTIMICGWISQSVSSENGAILLEYWSKIYNTHAYYNITYMKSRLYSQRKLQSTQIVTSAFRGQILGFLWVQEVSLLAFLYYNMYCIHYIYIHSFVFYCVSSLYTFVSIILSIV